MPTTEIFPSTRRLGTCRESRCQASITFAQIVKTGKLMPFDSPLEPISVHERETTFGRTDIWVVDLAKSHFATCPAAKRFSRKSGVQR
jgi:hypothetical protein